VAVSQSQRHLLDVNVWIALLDEGHTHHSIAKKLFSHPKLKIATCPLVENGVIRILNMPNYSAFGAVGFEPVREQLNKVCHDFDHEFWADDVTLRSAPVNWTHVMGHNQITDVYLLALAVAHDGCLTSFDRRIALSTVSTAKAKHLVLL
jgi:toxin-antitoxin system PIN domain toxin